MITSEQIKLLFNNSYPVKKISLKTCKRLLNKLHDLIEDMEDDYEDEVNLHDIVSRFEDKFRNDIFDKFDFHAKNITNKKYELLVLIIDTLFHYYYLNKVNDKEIYVNADKLCNFADDWLDLDFYYDTPEFHL